MTVEMPHTFFNWKGGGAHSKYTDQKKSSKNHENREMWGKDSVV